MPREVVSDNGPKFSAEGFGRFAEAYGFIHRTSSPLHTEANGKAEKAVGVVKNLLKRAKDSGGDPYLALMAYRQAPLEAGRSPAELLMGRCIQGILPMVTNSLVGEKVWKERQERVESRQERNYNKGAKDLEKLETGEVVRIWGKGWDRKAVVTKRVNPRSYVVRTEGGGVYRRNRRDLMSVKENWEQELETEKEQRVQEEGEEGVIEREREDSEAGDSSEEGEREVVGKDKEVKVSTPLRRSNRIRKGVDRLDL